MAGGRQPDPTGGAAGVAPISAARSSVTGPGATGPVAGGTVVKIKGKQFTKVKKVLFGTTKSTSVQVKNPRKLLVVAPPHAAGTVSVRVVTKGGKSKRSGKALFTYFGSPPLPVPFAVSGLAPASGPARPTAARRPARPARSTPTRPSGSRATHPTWPGSR